MRNLSAIYSNEEYKNLNATARDVFFLIYNQFTLSKKNVSKGNLSWKDDNGVFCYLGQKEIAAILGKADRTVRRAVEALKEAKLITVIERGARRKAKLYIHEVVNTAKNTPVEIEDEQVKRSFEETFGECANNSEAKALNDLSKSNKIEYLAEAIKRSKAVENKKARIKYIARVLASVIEDANKPKIIKPAKSKKIIREEQKPNWLEDQLKNGDGWDKVNQPEQVSDKIQSTTSKVLGGTFGMPVWNV